MPITVLPLAFLRERISLGTERPLLPPRSWTLLQDSSRQTHTTLRCNLLNKTNCTVYLFPVLTISAQRTASPVPVCLLPSNCGSGLGLMKATFGVQTAFALIPIHFDADVVSGNIGYHFLLCCWGI